MNETVKTIERIRAFHKRISPYRYTKSIKLEASFIYNGEKPIPYKQALSGDYKTIQTGEKWGDLWGSAWFRFEGTVPGNFAGREVMALIDVDGEAAVFEGSDPVMGLTYKPEEKQIHVKRRVPLFREAAGGEKVALLVEAGANTLFGNSSPAGGVPDDKDAYILKQAEIVCFNRDIWELALDIEVLLGLAESVPSTSPRYRKILSGLNRTANIWREGEGLKECRRITRELLDRRAHASAMTAWSVGHAHMDLAWLWPVRETRRKAGRTFSTALKLMEEYPAYCFGASQPQLYQWVKEDYPGLYSRIGEAVKKGNWECQGAMWVEPDMNLTGGESLVRQCLYGKAFFREEFGVDVTNLWLPDVFGYSAALPQILKKCGVDSFVTQKISWNDTNRFPWHTFHWEGIDGTLLLSHFLPTNTYNCSNEPRKLAAAENRFSQSDTQDDFLNLYGVGDGGGGPSRKHIEFARRMADTEGVPKVKMAVADEFFGKVGRTPAEELPIWSGELYLEFHRGTYTSQALIKKYNRRLELLLRDVEFLSVLGKRDNGKVLEKYWKNTLLNQFHDILPGTSIGQVYLDAHTLAEQTLEGLETEKEIALAELFGPENLKTSLSSGEFGYILINTLSWERCEIIRLPLPEEKSFTLTGPQGKAIPWKRSGKMMEFPALIPSMGYTTISVTPTVTDIKEESSETPACHIRETSDGGLMMENPFLDVKISEEGTIDSIFDKEEKREILSGPTNRLLLWEDRPYSYEAWEISHYYRETTPEQARLTKRKICRDTPFGTALSLSFRIGDSIIDQILTLDRTSRMIRIDSTVDWRETRKMLRVEAETTLRAREASYEIQFGTVKRPTHKNSSWDQAMFEVPAQRFADLSRPDYGLAVVNDCKYGYSIRENIIDLALLRSPKAPDPEADMRVHTFSYGYYPHKGDLNHSDVLQRAHDFNSSLTVVPAGQLPAEREKSFYSVTGNQVKIETVKKAESGKGIILRLYETAGTNARIELHSHTAWERIDETDLLENITVNIAGRDLKTQLEFKPFEIRTFLLHQGT